MSVDEVQVDDDVVRDVGDGGWFGKALVMKYQDFRNALDESERWNEKEVKLPDFSSGFVMYTNQANPFWICFQTSLPFRDFVEFNEFETS